jgi:hypothetical protein
MTAKQSWQAEDQTRPATYEPSEEAEAGEHHIVQKYFDPDRWRSIGVVVPLALPRISLI